jgi:hypothetical protein
MGNIDIEKVNTVLDKAVNHFQGQENEMLTTDLDVADDDAPATADTDTDDAAGLDEV